MKGGTTMDNTPNTTVARAMPRPTAQVAAYVEVLGVDLAMAFLMAYGGAELSLAVDPKGRASHEALLGYEKAKALAAQPRLQKRVPLAKRWLAAMLHWQGHSTAAIAWHLRVSDVSVRRWLKERSQ
jgi:hypothetical protein